jgi:hypothetical protein
MGSSLGVEFDIFIKLNILYAELDFPQGVDRKQVSRVLGRKILKKRPKKKRLRRDRARNVFIKVSPASR